MHLIRTVIQNFRQLEYIDIEFSEGINVIAGRNGIGKSNILEAVRLGKALLAPRTQSESFQALMSISAMSPHNNQVIIYDAIAGDPTKEISISSTFKLHQDEVEQITSNVQLIATELVRAQLGSNASNPAMAAFFSSPQGQGMVISAKGEVGKALMEIKNSNNNCRLFLKFDPKSGQFVSEFPIESHLIGFLDRNLSYDKTKFTYFPADRALPRGEVPLQMGQQDAGQNLESHNSQPQLKYGRLKNLIFNAIIASPKGKETIEKDFKTIFDQFLPGRELEGTGVSPFGTLLIRIKDAKAGRLFDIDQMSSGEKSLVLSFLIMSRGLAISSVVLMDEPELHLHPAVCKEMVPFLLKNYTNQNMTQMILCSHSPEILSGAFARDNCKIFHLQSGTEISEIEPSNKPAVEDTLRSLGTSETESLFYKAIISVEGRDDVDILEDGFPITFQTYKVKPQGSKSEVLTAIKKLKELEKNGDLNSRHYFIFDRDHKPAQEKSTSRVKVLEWDRHCIENYLLDTTVIAKVLQDSSISSCETLNPGTVKDRLRKLAFGQIENIAILKAFQNLEIPNAAYELADFKGMSVDGAATEIRLKLHDVQGHLAAVDADALMDTFKQKAQSIRTSMEKQWQTNWQTYCDGKRLFADMYQEFSLKVTPLKLKRRIVNEMRIGKNNKNWSEWKEQIEKFLKA